MKNNETNGRFNPHIVFCLLPFAFGLFSGCAPTVQLNTPEPLRVDISMTVDVNQHSDTGVSSSAQRKLGEAEVAALRRRDARGGEVWGIKNDQAAVENEQGYLEARPRPGWKPEYVDRLVKEENKDRRILYEADAKAAARPLEEVEREAGRQLRRQAYGPAK